MTDTDSSRQIPGEGMEQASMSVLEDFTLVWAKNIISIKALISMPLNITSLQ